VHCSNTTIVHCSNAFARDVWVNAIRPQTKRAAVAWTIRCPLDNRSEKVLPIGKRAA